MDERWFEVAGFWIRTQRRGAAKKMRAYRSFGFIVAQTTIPLVPCAVSETVAISSSTLLSLIPGSRVLSAHKVRQAEEGAACGVKHGGAHPLPLGPRSREAFKRTRCRFARPYALDPSQARAAQGTR